MKCMCWICWGEAYRKGIYGDWDDVVCYDCGRYKISRRFLAEHVGQKFDVAVMRQCFELAQVLGLVPIVDKFSAVFQARHQPHPVKADLVGWPTSGIRAHWLIEQ